MQLWKYLIIIKFKSDIVASKALLLPWYFWHPSLTLLWC